MTYISYNSMFIPYIVSFYTLYKEIYHGAVNNVDYDNLFLAFIIANALFIFLFMFVCVLLSNITFDDKIILEKAITIDKAMRLLDIPAHKEKHIFFQYNDITFYKTKEKLSDSIHENVECTTINDYYLNFYLYSREKVLTSPKYCCNYDDVMRVLKKQPHSKDLEKITNKANKESMIIEESIKTLVTATVNLFEEDKPISGYTKNQFIEKV